jgi:RHS repeat-associated protein
LIGETSGPVHLVSRAYESNRDATDTIENKVGSATVSKYDYSTNAMGQRSARAQSGSAFAQTSTDTFSYDSKGEAVSATNSAQSARNQSFTYDQSGNRLSFASATGTAAYASNSLNQYTTIQAPASVSPAFDAEGNQTANGLGTVYSWDAENHLVSIEPAVAAAGDKKVINTYDYQGRRVRRQVSTFASGAWSLTTDEKFIHDGWNVIAVLGWNPSASAFALAKVQTWGLDLSGSFQGAGGIGGLLAVSEISNGQVSASYHYTYDANGNVSELLNGLGTVAAHYEYDAFGGNLAVSGAYATANEYRFSTKPLDSAAGLYYYGFRHYDPLTGRWMSRDPIEEKGGNNLYRAADNDFVNKYDILGQILGLDFDYTQNLQLGGCMPIPGVPFISICLTGGYSVTVDECCVPGEGEKNLITVSGDINLYAAIQAPSPFTYSYTKGAVITREGRPPDCPTPGGDWNGNVWVGFNAGFLNGQCTYDSGSWSCSLNSQFFPQWNVYGGGTLSITKTIIQ